ncbi:MAG: T9SS type A sorting domain-containing protein [Ignavibacteria bacterium]|nr:T9SS type A sorting domain-containing protein [Ignavibacteria bacterium]
MNRLIQILLLVLSFNFIYSQDFQVSNMQGYVVESPKFTISTGNIYLTFPTNMRVYKFPVAGPQAPISNPINPDPTQWGPGQCDIASVNNFIYVLFTDYLGGQFIIKLAFSNDYGNNWNSFVLDTINNTNYLPTRYDLPRAVVSDVGRLYCFYFVFENSKDTSGIYMYDLFNNSRKKIDVFFPKARYEYAITPFVKTINNVDHIFLSYWIDSSFYTIKSTNAGQTFSQPQKIVDVSVPWPMFDWQSTFQYDASGKLYFKYDYRAFDFPYDEGRKFFVKTSQDLGQTWSAATLIDTSMGYVEFVVVGNDFVKYYCENDRNLYLQTSKNLTNWGAKVRVNSVDSSISSSFYERVAASPYLNKIAFAWKDRRTGNDEIFYRLMDIPTTVNETISPNEFILYQNYPNPFNPVTSISFNLKNKSHASLKVYDVFGKLIKVLVDDLLESGNHEYKFEAIGISSGVYYYTLNTNGIQQTKKMILIK